MGFKKKKKGVGGEGGGGGERGKGMGGGWGWGGEFGLFGKKLIRMGMGEGGWGLSGTDPMYLVQPPISLR